MSVAFTNVDVDFINNDVVWFSDAVAIVSPSLSLKLALLSPTIIDDVLITPATLALLLTLTEETILHDLVITPSILALNLILRSSIASSYFPTLSTSPHMSGWVDEFGDDAVTRDVMKSGYPNLNLHFDFDAKNFLHTLQNVSQADKLIVMEYYNKNKANQFFWSNEQDNRIYVVMFMSKPGCRLDGSKNEWRLDFAFKQTVE